MSGVIVIEANPKAGKIGLMLFGHIGNHLFWSHTQLLSLEHDRCAMGIICTDEVDGVAAQALITHPDISLDMFQHVAEVNGAICVRQGTGNQNFTS